MNLRGNANIAAMLYALQHENCGVAWVFFGSSLRKKENQL